MDNDLNHRLVMHYLKIFLPLFLTLLWSDMALSSDGEQFNPRKNIERNNDGLPDLRDGKRAKSDESVPIIPHMRPFQDNDGRGLKRSRGEGPEGELSISSEEHEIDLGQQLDAEQQSQYLRVLSVIGDQNLVLREYGIHDIRDIMHILEHVESERLCQVIDQSSVYCKPSKNKKNFIDLLSALSFVPIATMDVVFVALNNIPSTGKIAHRVELIENLRLLNKPLAEAVVAEVLDFKERNKWTPQDCYAAITALVSIKQNVLEQVLARTRNISLVGEGWGGQLYGEVADSFSHVPVEMLQRVQDCLAPIILDVGASCSELPALIYRLGQVDPLRFDRILSRLGVFRAGLNACDSLGYVTLLDAVTSIPPDCEDDISVLERHILTIKQWKSASYTLQGWTGHLHGLSVKTLAQLNVALRFPLLNFIAMYQEMDYLEMFAVEAFLKGFKYVPPGQESDYLEGAYSRLVTLQKEDDFDYEHNAPQDNLIIVLSRFARIMKKKDEAKFLELLAHWKAIFQSSDILGTEILSRAITDDYEALGLYEGHPYFEQAISAGSQLSPDLYSNPPCIYLELKRKREAVVDWSLMKAHEIVCSDLRMRLNHLGVARFGPAFKMDPSSVPDTKKSDFKRLLKQLQTHVKEGREALTKEQRQLLKHINADMSNNSHKSGLLKSPVDSMQGNKFRCIVKYLLSIEDVDIRMSKLSNLLFSVRNCGPGQNTSIDDWYNQLPIEFRMRTTVGNFEFRKNELSALEMLLVALREVIEEDLSEAGPLIQAYCNPEGLPDVKHAAHQALYVNNLIGWLLTSNEGLKYDRHGNCVDWDLLDMSLQTMLEEFYNYMNFNRFMDRVLTAFNKHFFASKKDLQDKVYNSLTNIHTQSKVYEHFSCWIEMSYENDLDLIGKYAGITLVGLMRVMQRAGLLVEVKEPKASEQIVRVE